MKLKWLPNALCVLRLLLSIPIAFLLLQGEFLISLLLFVTASATDAADGFLAKQFGWQTEMGKILDPLADKILVFSVYMTLSVLSIVPFWLSILVVLRDVIIIAGAACYRFLYGPIMGAAPTIYSKLNTLIQVTYVAGLIAVRAVHSMGEGWPSKLFTAWGLWLVVATTIISGSNYVWIYIRRALIAHSAKSRLDAIG